MRLKPRLGLNPIIVKELRSRMRGTRAFAVLTGTLLLLGMVSYALYRLVLTTSRYSNAPLSPTIGQTLFTGLAFLELMMVCFVTPAVTAGAISGEMEKLTYEMLLATPLRPASILWGKLISALSYVFLLIFAAIPMASLVFIFGGVAPRDMIKTLVVLVAVAGTLGVVGIFMSTWLRRTGRATVLSYLVVLVLLIGPLLVYILVGVLRQAEPPRWILVPNPVSALFSALSPAEPDNGPAGIFWGLGMVLGGNLRILSGSSGQAGIPRPLYHYTLPLYGVTVLVLFILATRLVQPTHGWRVRRKEVVPVLALLLASGSAVALVFATTADRYEKASIFATPTPVALAIAEREVVRAVQVEPTVAPPPAPVPTDATQVDSPSPTSTPSLSEDDQAAIYAAVVRQLYTVDHTFGEPPNFPVVYLLRPTDDSVGDPNAPRAESRLVPEAVQGTVLAALAAQPDLPAEFKWVDDRDQVPTDANFKVEGDGAIFTLGNIHQQPDESVFVSASLYFAPLGAGGRTYVLKIVEGFWQIVGDTGVEWIS
jgi:ABC-2 type transport system permease protein